MAPLYESCPNLRMETMYNTTCMAAKMALSSKVNEKQPDVCFQRFLFKLVASIGIRFLRKPEFRNYENKCLKVTSQQLSECVISRRKGSENLQTAVRLLYLL